MADETISGLPLVLEQLLREAAHDETFRKALLADRLTAAEQRGHQLNASERAILDAVPQDQLSKVLERLAEVPPTLPQPMPTMVETAGIRPERLACEGIRPGRTKRLLGAVVTTAALGGAATYGYVTLTKGARSNPPRVTNPATPAADAATDVDRTDVDPKDVDPKDVDPKDVDPKDVDPKDVDPKDVDPGKN